MLGDGLCPPPQDEKVPPRKAQKGSTLNLHGQRRPVDLTHPVVMIVCLHEMFMARLVVAEVGFLTDQ